MSKSIKLQNNTYLDSSSIVHNKELLSTKIIHDSGSNDNGSWVRFEDGTMICFGEKELGDINCTSAWGSVYESPVVDFGFYPQKFITRPTLILQQASGGTCYPETLSNSTNEKLGTTWFWRPKADTCRDVIYSFFAIGKWK